jgi:hypothetical protein
MSDNIRNGIAYGCHVELAEDEQPDDCVVDYGAYGDCIHGHYRNGQPRRTKWTCKYWRPIDAALSQDTPSLPLKPQEAVKPAGVSPSAPAGTLSEAE